VSFAKLLIANRGEIACRIMRTARRMGIRTVAVYSAADAEALHVREADEAVAIGPAPSRDSYLRIDRIVEAAQASGADAVHPGYGFLSENAAFAAALEAAGIAFIGPDAAAIAAMGDKIESKKLAERAGVASVPAHLAALGSADEAVAIAGTITYPVMLKASAGGGGKGMRIARNAREVREGLAAAQAEARSSFGDDRIFVEKYIEHPRHIEIQILADRHGTILHLGERECSLQRRHQKVIEEAPSPVVDAALRQAMGAQAVALARAVSYVSAGTVEFIMDRDRNFYFLEMNTRLQVEHPVTELVTGLDLVEWMIRIAGGEKLPLRQSDIGIAGWAIEARLYAEDPQRNFLPSAGRLRRYRPPAGDGLRTDSGVAEGSEIPVHYDPMIAKLVVHAESRDKAVAALGLALDGFALEGVRHNLEFLSALAAHPDFAAGALSTDLIGTAFPQGFSATEPTGAARDALLALAAALHQQAAARATKRPAQDWVARVGRANHPLSVMLVEGGADVRIGASLVRLRGALAPGSAVFTGSIDGAPVAVRLARQGSRLRLARGGHALTVQMLEPRAAALADLMPDRPPPDLSRLLLSPMPGLLVALAVGAGDEVKQGEPLATIEAMKMQNVLRAERDGRIARILVEPGASLAVDEVILEFA